MNTSTDWLQRLPETDPPTYDASEFPTTQVSDFEGGPCGAPGTGGYREAA
ncbi:hypothetical protein AB5J55_43705 [Streptomyces sp. R11]|uniref:Uncharacterized protein n=1 Tax=Streptomyces sp. R11 TaxID=3238625 RepID=A0AB39NC57_9ACTN